MRKVMAGRVGDDASGGRQDITGRREAEEGRRHPDTTACRTRRDARAKISEGNVSKGERARARAARETERERE